MSTSVLFVGVDWAVDPRNRASVTLSCMDEHIAIQDIQRQVDDPQIVAFCQDPNVSVVAVDIPFGWPEGASAFVGTWSPLVPTPVPTRQQFRYRLTELTVHLHLGIWPLSVSSDRIALGARHWCDLVATHNLHDSIDVCADPKPDQAVIEVYPKATLYSFREPVHLGENELRHWKTSRVARSTILGVLLKHFDIASLDMLEDLVGTQDNDSDIADAAIAAMTALAYRGYLNGWSVMQPTVPERGAARQEGWIFYPAQP